MLARAHQDAIWRRTAAHHQLRSLLREFYPTFLAVFTGRFTLGIASPEARGVLAIAPTPAAAAKLSVSRISAAFTSRRPQPRHRSDRGRYQSRIAETASAPTSSDRDRDG